MSQPLVQKLLQKEILRRKEQMKEDRDEDENENKDEDEDEGGEGERNINEVSCLGRRGKENKILLNFYYVANILHRIIA